MSERILVLGASGLLGRAVLRHVPPGVTALAPAEEELRLEDRAGMARFLREEAVDRVLLLAAWTQVDACEEDPERAFRINGILPGLLAAMLERLHVPLLFMSTDYVFDGRSPRPYREFDPVSPLGVYARSKWHGECAVRAATSSYRIVRSCGLYGPGGPDFVRAVLKALESGPVPVVTDEEVSPTYVEDLAPALWTIARSEETGTFHLAAGGSVSRFHMARRIAEQRGLDPGRVLPTTRAALGRAAPRPPRSILDCQAAREVFGLALPSWEDGLRRFLQEPEAAP
jgi:dTDP-4-dehydrorhamnose reductase